MSLMLATSLWLIHLGWMGFVNLRKCCCTTFTPGLDCDDCPDGATPASFNVTIADMTQFLTCAVCAGDGFFYENENLVGTWALVQARTDEEDPDAFDPCLWVYPQSFSGFAGYFHLYTRSGSCLTVPSEKTMQIFLRRISTVAWRLKIGQGESD